MSAVNIKNEKCDVYIGRPSEWGNPFVIGKHGDRQQVVWKYEVWLNTQPRLLKRVKELKGKKLGCFCAPLICHGDILTTYANGRYTYNWFSNMIPFGTPYKYQGIKYYASENFYQAMKLPKERTDLRREIAAMSPYSSKSNIKKYEYQEDWEENKLKVMKYILQYKFSLPIWKEKLELTEDWEITEWNDWGDVYWGKDLKSGEGENHLGKILMEIREKNRCK